MSSEEDFDRGEQLAVMAAHMDAAKHRFLVTLREFEASGSWVRQGFRTCPQWMSWRIGLDVHTSREYVRVAKALATLPLIDEALRTAAVSYSKVRAMTRVATPTNESVLLEQARLTTATQLATICRKYATVVRSADDAPDPKQDAERRHVSRRELDDGMIEIRAVLHPEEAEQVWAALDRMASELCAATTGADDAAHDARTLDAIAPTQPSPGEGTVIGGRGDVLQTHRVDEDGDRALEDAGTAGGDCALEDAGSASGDCVLADAGTAVGDHVFADSTPQKDGVLEDTAAGQDVLVDGTTGEDVLLADARAIRRADEPVDARGETDGSERSRAPEHTTRTSPEPMHAVEPEDADDALARAWAWSPRTDPTYLTIPESMYEDDGVDDTPTVTTIDLRKLPSTPAMRAHRREEQRVAFDRATALVAIADRFLRGAADQRTPTEVTLTIPVAALAGANDVTSLGSFASGASVPAETARRICCDTGIVPMVEDPEGRPVAIGHKSRTISGAVKRALLKRDRTCTFPGCTTRVFLQGHHVEHWADGGKTTLDNLCLLCSHHHRFVHEYRYAVEIVDGAPVFHEPNGKIVPAAPRPAQPAKLGWSTLEELHADLEITAQSYGDGYDGWPFSYHDLIHALVKADDL